MRVRSRVAVLAVVLGAFASVSPAYYHFLHFASRNAPFRGIPEKFDLGALPNKTLSYFISDPGRVQFSANDSYAGLVSEIRAAAKAWNDVETSDLRLAFGGLIAPGSLSAAPTLEITFDELPPGLIAAGGPMVRGTATGTSVPILKSVIIVQPDLTDHPSYSESFFGTIVHEMGHGLGLQHTFTSSVMSTARTRATTKSRPLAADDIAGISVLYPRQNFAANTGVISGRVTLSSSGVSLASVVAIAPNGVAVSTLTNPDGTYRIEGLPTRRYLVYVHPLPPALQGQSSPGDIVFPLDANATPFNPGPNFETVFYPGTNDPSQASPVDVAAGQTVSAINFTVRSRSASTIHTVSTYSFPGNIAVQPPYLNLDPRMRPFVVASGYGLVNGSAPVSGLSVGILGGSTLATRPYAPAPNGFIQMDINIGAFTFSGDSPRHLVFSANNDIYVLPSAFTITEKMPPGITGITSSGDSGGRTVTLSGTNLTASTRVLFDGVQAATKSFDENSGRLSVVSPAAPPGHKANIVAFNQDGQSSLFLDDFPLTFQYSSDSSSSGSSMLAAAPSALPAGVEGMVQIDAPNASFQDGQVTIGFGSSDIVVRRFWVVSATRLLVNIAVSPQAQGSTTNLTVVSGLQVLTQPLAFTVQPANSKATWLNSSVMNANGQSSLTLGSSAVLNVGGTPASSVQGASVYLNDKQVPVLAAQGNMIMFQIPSGTPTGPTVLRAEFGGERSIPIAVSISPRPPQIAAVTSGANQTVDGSHPARAGEILTLSVSNFEQPGNSVDASRVAMIVAGVELPAASVLEQGGVFKVVALLPASTPAGMQQVSVRLDDRISDPFSLPVTN